MRIPATLPEIGVAVRDILSDQAVMTKADLLAELQRCGVDLGTDPAEALEELLETDDVGLVMSLADERITYLPALLSGRTFTHRLTDAEVAHGFIEDGADLEALLLLTDEPRYQRLRDGSPVVDVLAGFDDDLLQARGLPVGEIPDAAWYLAPDTLRAWTAGDLVGVTVHPDGFGFDAATATQPPADLAERLTSAITREGRDGPAQLDSVVWDLCVEDPTLFTRPLPPLHELLDEHGFVHDVGQLALPGFDLPRWRTERRAEHLQHTHDLDEDQALAVLVLQRLHASTTELLELASNQPDLPEEEPYALRGEDGEEAVRRTLEYLTDLAVTAETMGSERVGAAALGMLAESLEARAPRQARPALRWLQGKALDRLGRVRRAEEAYDSALALDPDWLLALFDLARIVSDRGDAERGLSLLHRAGARPDDELVTLLQHFRPVERTDIGRNQPWCSARRRCAAPSRTRSRRRWTRRTTARVTSGAGTSTSRRTACNASARSSRSTARRCRSRRTASAGSTGSSTR